MTNSRSTSAPLRTPPVQAGQPPAAAGLPPIQQHVRLTFDYAVHFTRGLFDVENPLLHDVIHSSNADPRALFVIDAGVADAHPNLLGSLEAYCQKHDIELAGPTLLIPGGEQSKNNPRHLNTLYDAIHAVRLCRHSFLVVIGGGAVIDLAGYAAATAHRGIRLIRVPTTVLAQNDSAVGVKNSVNAFGRKNFLGTFAPPVAVLNDSNFLATLADRDWVAGISEGIKVSLIKDAPFFDAIERNAPLLVQRDTPAMLQLIHRCAQLHVEHIGTGGDPFESGSSRPLDFGHWAAHKLEQMTDHRLRHGEAVSIGMALDATYSHQAGLLSELDWRRVLTVLSNCSLPIYAPELERGLDSPADFNSILHGLEEFREHLGGQLTITLLKGIGQGIEVHAMDVERVRSSVAALREFTHQTEHPTQSSAA